MRWNKEKIDTDEVRSLSARYGISALAASILVRRGITRREELKFTLENDLRLLHNPFLFMEMEEAVDRINQAVEEGEKIFVYGDRDVDGITSTVMITHYLRSLGADVSWSLPQGDDAYGLAGDVVEEIQKHDCTLCITVDCGISNNDEISLAQSRGIDTIVIDHHLPPDELPPAYAIINPKIDDSGYPFRDLAGCGVVSKVIWALSFSRTTFYNRSISLLNIRPGNDTYIIEVIKLLNLIEIDKITENIVPGITSLEQTRLMPFLQGQEIFVYEKNAQTAMFQKVFGSGVELQCYDITSELKSTFPAYLGMSLLKMREKSRFAKYEKSDLQEIEILRNLFISILMKKEPGLSSQYRQYMDLAALGTIADLMPVTDENRIIIRQGLEILQNNPRPGLSELLFLQNLKGKKIGTKDLAWQITPLINSTGRMGVPNRAVDLFLSEENEDAAVIAKEVLQLNKERKKIGDKLWEEILPKARTSYQDLNTNLIVVRHRNINRGITGILAARLVSQFNTPAIIMANLETRVVGSMRSIPGLHVKNFLERFSDFFTDFGGHEFAGGFSVPMENIDAFLEHITKIGETMKPMEKEEPNYNIDAEIPHSYMNPELIKIVELFEPYGESNPPLTFKIQDVVLESVDVVGKGEKTHAKMLIQAGKNKWPAVYWNMGSRVGKEFSKNDKADILFRLGRNYFQNTETLQLTIIDLQRK